jgi:hypothetical protein
MLYLIAAADTGKGIWGETFGLVFTFVVLMPVLTIACLIVARVASRGEKRADDEMLGRWGRRRRPTSEE